MINYGSRKNVKPDTKVGIDLSKLISFVIPCYMSEGSVALVIDEIRKTVSERKEDYSYEIIAVNDASPDNLFSVIKKIAEEDSNVTAIDLAKNVGRHNAILCGCRYANGEYIVFTDDDLQCPMDHLWDLISPIESGECDAAMAKYSRKKQSWFKNIGSKVNDAVSTWLLGKDKDLKFSNFYAIKSYIKDEIIKYENPYPYISGLIVRATGYIKNVPMEERERTIGEGHYNFRKSFSLWLNNFTSFSIKPLRIATCAGILFAFIGFILALITVIRKIVNPQILAGYSSIMAALFVIGGLIMLILGLIGEYLGRVFISINSAPQYVIREMVSGDNK